MIWSYQLSWWLNKGKLATTKSFLVDISLGKRANAQNINLETLYSGLFTLLTQQITLNYLCLMICLCIIWFVPFAFYVRVLYLWKYKLISNICPKHFGKISTQRHTSFIMHTYMGFIIQCKMCMHNEYEAMRKLFQHFIKSY